MIALIGHGYIGSAFAKEINRLGLIHQHLSHEDVGGFWKAHEHFKNHRPTLVINCAAFIPPESVSLCDKHPAETITGNTIFPAMLAHVCQDQGIPLAHISTGCLWSDGREHPEDDPPQRAFSGYCGFYIGAKILSEQCVRQYPQHYVWRIRLPFDEYDCARNYLRKLADFKEVFDHDNSLSHRGDFVRACLDLWKIRAPFGTYNVMNPGSVRAKNIIDRLLVKGIRSFPCKIVSGVGGDTKVNVEKLLSTGVSIRPVEEALSDSLNNWQ